MRFSIRKLVFSSVVLILGSASANASQFSTIYAFGDSLSDAGNAYAAVGVPTPPYVNGHFTNGQVWVQDLSASLGLGPLTASLTGGNDFAVGSAFSGSSSVHTGGLADLPAQLASFQALHATADPNAIYTIWIGSNDLEQILQVANPAAYSTAAAAVVANIDSAINTLAGDGAKNVLLLTVPDLGKTPAAIALGPAAQAAASALAGQFNVTLVNGSSAAGLPSLTSLAKADGINLSLLDTYSLIDAIVSHPGAFGFTDVTDACVTGSVNYVSGTACSPSVATQNQYLFWDDIHPTSSAHSLIAQDALVTLTPEPASFALIAAGGLAIGLLRRRTI